jgi:hypothetical protein
MAHRYRAEGLETGTLLPSSLLSIFPSSFRSIANAVFLGQAGNFVREEISSAFIRLVCHTPELQAYTVQKLYVALLADVSQDSLTLSGVWLIGEFGDVLLQGWVAEEGEESRQVS